MSFEIGLGVSTRKDSWIFSKLNLRLWYGTSNACDEWCLLKYLLNLTSLHHRIGIATISYLFLKDLSADLQTLIQKNPDVKISVGIGDRFRLKKYKPSVSHLKESVSRYPFINYIATSYPPLIKFASENDFGIIFNSGSISEIQSAIGLIDPQLIIAYLPVYLPRLPLPEKKAYDAWVSRMVGKRTRSDVEVHLEHLSQRIIHLKEMGIGGVILSAPWSQNSVRKLQEILRHL